MENQSDLACQPNTSRIGELWWRLKDRIIELAYRLRLLKRPKSNTRLHAERELVAVGYDLNDQEEGPNKWIMENLFELLDIFDKQGHSGSSAPYCANMFAKLALFKPLGPLTGADDEWSECHDGCFQNKRASHVFKQADRFNGQAYDINGKVFREPNGCCYTSSESCVPVTFPYTPKTEYVDVDEVK